MSSKRPLVSILMTSYNREKYIDLAIQSVVELNYTNWELILCDDRSTDDTVEIARVWSARDSRIKVFINEENLGDYGNRNRAASHASGEYLKYLDADDYIYKYALDIMVESMEQFPEAAFGLSRPQSNEEIYPIRLDSRSAYLKHYLHQHFLINSPGGSIIRRAQFQELGGFSGVRHIGDFELWLNLAQHFPVVIMIPGLIHWRRHGDQENAKSRKKDYLIVDKLLMNLRFVNAVSSPLNDQEKRIVSSRIKHEFIRYLLVDTLRMKRPFRNLKLLYQSKLTVLEIFRSLYFSERN